MALIKCLECEKDISDSAKSCPHCGHPVVEKAGVKIQAAPSAPPPKKKMAMWKKIAVGSGLALLALILLAGQQTPEQKAAREQEKAQVQVERSQAQAQADALKKEERERAQAARQQQRLGAAISPGTLWQAFDSNEVAAEKKYKGQEVVVTGRIAEINTDLFGAPQIVFNVDGYGFNRVYCSFSKENRDAVGELSKGQKITLAGTCRGMTIKSVSMSDCEIVQ